MAKNQKDNKNTKKPKPSVKVQDLSPQKNPTGGRKAGSGQHEYLIVKLENGLVESADLPARRT